MTRPIPEGTPKLEFANRLDFIEMRVKNLQFIPANEQAIGHLQMALIGILSDLIEVIREN